MQMPTATPKRPLNPVGYRLSARPTIPSIRAGTAALLRRWPTSSRPRWVTRRVAGSKSHRSRLPMRCRCECTALTPGLRKSATAAHLEAFITASRTRRERNSATGPQPLQRGRWHRSIRAQRHVTIGAGQFPVGQAHFRLGSRSLKDGWVCVKARAAGARYQPSPQTSATKGTRLSQDRALEKYAVGVAP